MKGYVVTLFNLPQSVEVADRCVASGRKFGVEIEKFPGVWRDSSMQELVVEGLKPGLENSEWSNPPAVFGNFIAQYRIWKLITEKNEGAIIFEHDAIVVAPIPDPTGRGDIINYGRPSFSTVPSKDKAGFYPLFSAGNKIPGAHGYYVTPAGAKKLVAKAKEIGAWPADKFIRPQHFDNIIEYWPWPIIVDDHFTTIQKEKGCLSKHNYSKDFKIL